MLFVIAVNMSSMQIAGLPFLRSLSLVSKRQRLDFVPSALNPDTPAEIAQGPYFRAQSAALSGASSLLGSQSSDTESPVDAVYSQSLVLNSFPGKEDLLKLEPGKVSTECFASWFLPD